MPPTHPVGETIKAFLFTIRLKMQKRECGRDGARISHCAPSQTKTKEIGKGRLPKEFNLGVDLGAPGGGMWKLDKKKTREGVPTERSDFPGEDSWQKRNAAKQKIIDGANRMSAWPKTTNGHLHSKGISN